MVIRSRLAPTPSGFLHYGNLLNFVLTSVETRRRGGTLLLRIDDLDAIRSRDEFIEDIFSTLHALGLPWDEGPVHAEDFRARHSQALKTPTYREFLTRFPGYACSCSRQQLQSRGSAVYDGHCRDRGLTLQRDHTQWRLRSASPENDLVLWRKEDLPSYHLVSLCEDLSAGINLIVRGEDLRESTEQQKCMARMLGESGRRFLEAEFLFHPLLLGEGGAKLSKSEGSHSLRSELRRGRTAEQVFLELSRLAGRPAARTLAEAIDRW